MAQFNHALCLLVKPRGAKALIEHAYRSLVINQARISIAS
jgi:hypothetical protein